MPSRPGQCRPRPNSLSSSPQPRSPGSPHHQDARGPPRPRTPPSASSSWSSSSGRRQAPPVGEGPPSRATRGTPRPDQVPSSIRGGRPGPLRAGWEAPRDWVPGRGPSALNGAAGAGLPGACQAGAARRGLLGRRDAGASVYGHTTLNAPDLV